MIYTPARLAHTADAAPRFSEAERHYLLQQPGIGASVIGRLEQVGITSIAELRATGAQNAVATVCSLMGNVAWVNRLRPLERALSLYVDDCVFALGN